jgi:hypothetical protein
MSRARYLAVLGVVLLVLSSVVNVPLPVLTTYLAKPPG